ncbi:Transcriptional regulator, AbiEi antitoxin, Type IV TA system [Pasteurella testudinis DSM 23072]|uniref:Transcriptional regulator, AbiEi antitoxin, Type IV TA system n=1 Tax=Pasteurella testudinis DSM 23072 TaxID=1122938 RepID=A0A1W1UVL0_9PAST|nr:DUF6088 family protein [Pasteurella testudinis]SMB85137.1 Transcriptional regulator, AbiEi antitoxin, Type IV TA system [Pasteurella testudinis DSM 23072]SUB52124.1 Uncharacterised protein [Pasteurella testudinis]
MPVAKEIRERITTLEPGVLFSSREFVELGNRAVVDQALSRMVRRGEIERAARGFFFRPKKNRFIGNVPLDVQTVVEAISQQNGETVQVHGAEAARQFKLSTQMPVQTVFHTNGATRKIRVGNKEVQMLHTSNQRKLQHAGTKVGLAISALWYLGKDLVTPAVIAKIRAYLKDEEFTTLKNANLTGWMHEVIHQTETIGVE